MSEEMSEENDISATAVSTKESKKKRKLNEEKGHKSSKKRKQVPDEETIIEQEYGIIPEIEQAQTPLKKEKKKHKKKGKESLLSPERTSPSRATPALNATSPTKQTSPVKKSLTPPPSQYNQSSTSLSTFSSSSSFRAARASLLLPLPPIAISTTTALSSLLAQHISPLLLTYHPPLKGIIMSFSDPVLSSTKPTDAEATTISSEDSPIPLAHCRDEHGVSFIWLTVTFALFCPRPGSELQGFINTATDGFVGLVTYNYFQVSIGKERIPSNWKWIESIDVSNNAVETDAKKKKKKKKGKTTKLNDSSPTSQRADASTSTPSQDQDPNPDLDPTASDTTASGFYALSTSSSSTPTPISGPVAYRVTDTELIPSEHAADKWSLRIMGTLLDDAEETALREKERDRLEARERRRKEGGGAKTGRTARSIGRTTRGGRDGDGDIVMSGALVGDVEEQAAAEGEKEDLEMLAGAGSVGKGRKKKHRKEY